MPGTHFQVEGSQLGIGIEAVEGTPAATPFWVPVDSPQMTPAQKWLRDTGFRGVGAMNYDSIPGVRNDEFTAKHKCYPDAIGVELMAMLGSTDTVTGSGPYLHSFALLLSPTTGNQPPPLTVYDFDGANAFRLSGARIDEVNFTWATDAELEVDIKLIGGIWHLMTSGEWAAITPSYTGEEYPPGWNFTTKVAGGALPYIEDGKLSFKRGTAPIFTGGNQAPRTVFAPPVDVTGEINGLIESTSDPMTAATGSGEPWGFVRTLPSGGSGLTLENTFTNVVNGHSVDLKCSQVQFVDPTRDRGKKYLTFKSKFDANANAVDALGGGFSPAQVAISNAVSTAYSTGS